MRNQSYTEKAREWVVDYSEARAKAIEWLGDRYLLAKPVRRLKASESCDSTGRLAQPSPDLILRGL